MKEVVCNVMFFGTLVAIIVYFVVGIRGYKKLLHDRDKALRDFDEAIKPGVRLVQKELARPLDPFIKWTPTYLKVEDVRVNTEGDKWVLVFDGITSRTMEMSVLYEMYELL